MIWSFVFLILIFVFAFCYYKHFRKPKLGTFVIVTGGVKSGKSTSSVASSIRYFKRKRFKVKIINFIRKLLNKPLLEIPLYYSNVPIDTGCGYVPITKELLLREKRFRYGSVVYFQEASFLAGAMDYGCESVDDAIKALVKLIGHETKGGALFVDTQAISDLHNAFRRSCSMELYIYKTAKVPILPFLIIWYKQLYFNEDGQMVNVNTANADDDLRKMLVFSRVWKRFDCYCYSVMTDDLEVVDNIVKPVTIEDFKANDILRLKDYIKKDKKRSSNYYDERN